MFLGGVPALLTSHIWYNTVHGKKTLTNSFSMEHITVFFSHELFPFLSPVFFSLCLCHFFCFSVFSFFLFLFFLILSFSPPPTLTLSLLSLLFSFLTLPVPPFCTSFLLWGPFHVMVCGTRRGHSGTWRFAHFRWTWAFHRKSKACG